MLKPNVLINSPVVVEYPDTGEWVVSFSNHNPSDEECFVCNTKEDSFRLKELVDSFVHREIMRIGSSFLQQTNSEATLQVCCGHDSDCAIHNKPAERAGPCDCGYEEKTVIDYDTEVLLDCRYWLQKIMKDHGAIITGSGFGMGVADIDIEQNGNKWIVSIRRIACLSNKDNI